MFLCYSLPLFLSYHGWNPQPCGCDIEHLPTILWDLMSFALVSAMRKFFSSSSTIDMAVMHDPSLNGVYRLTDLNYPNYPIGGKWKQSE